MRHRYCSCHDKLIKEEEYNDGDNDINYYCPVNGEPCNTVVK